MAQNLRPTKWGVLDFKWHADRGGLAVVPLLLDLFFAFLPASLIPFAFGIERPTR